MLGSKLIPVVVFVFSATVVMANVGNGQQSVGELMEELSNWGRWGEEDQLGTLNLITPQTVSYTHLTLPTILRV